MEEKNIDTNANNVNTQKTEKETQSIVESPKDSIFSLSKIEISLSNNPWWKKILLYGALVIGSILAFLSFKGNSASIGELNKEIKDKKKETQELKKEAVVIEKEISDLQKQTKVTEAKVKEKNEEFDKFIENTPKEAEVFKKEKTELLKTSEDTENNMEWVKQKFGGNIKYEE